MGKDIIPIQRIAQAIFLIRGQKVMLSQDLAALYGVAVKALNQAVKRHAARFPADFVFQITSEEFDNLKSQFVTSSWGGLRRALPYAFTRTRRGDVIQRAQQRTRREGQHRDHARVREAARGARNKSRARAKVFRARKARRQTGRRDRRDHRCDPAVDGVAEKISARDRISCSRRSPALSHTEGFGA